MDLDQGTISENIFKKPQDTLHTIIIVGIISVLNWLNAWSNPRSCSFCFWFWVVWLVLSSSAACMDIYYTSTHYYTTTVYLAS